MNCELIFKCGRRSRVQIWRLLETTFVAKNSGDVRTVWCSAESESLKSAGEPSCESWTVKRLDETFRTC